MRPDLGDFQTPPDLARQLVDHLRSIGVTWKRVLEPTCGRGNFLTALGSEHSELRGIECQPHYVEICRRDHRDVAILEANLFDLDLRTALDWTTSGPLLVIGNPPWITRSALGVLNSYNYPEVSTHHLGRGLDACTGTANYDLAEAVWIKLLTELADQTPTIALLCKPSVARRVYTYAIERAIPLRLASFRKIDARHWFDIGVEAGLFHLEVGAATRSADLHFFDSLTAGEPSYTLASTPTPISPRGLVWRQGVKHDLAAVMELQRQHGRFMNGFHEVVDIEQSHRLPLLKGRDLGRLHAADPSHDMVLPQRHTSDDTSRLETLAPRLWDYLQHHEARFQARKSSIYRGRPRFCLFGVGPYSFTPYKVAISGLHKQATFHAIAPDQGHPVVVDDTCYILPCASAESAALIATLLNSTTARSHLMPLVYTDAKRPITQKVLRTLDLTALWSSADQSAIMTQAVQVTWPRLAASSPLPPPDWQAATDLLMTGNLSHV